MAECTTCETELDTEQGMKIHHANVHDEPLTQNKWKCVWCNETFIRPESQVDNTDKTFCSKQCHCDWISENEHTRVEVECEYCNEIFERPEKQLEERENYFCSHECHSDWKLE